MQQKEDGKIVKFGSENLKKKRKRKRSQDYYLGKIVGATEILIMKKRKLLFWIMVILLIECAIGLGIAIRILTNLVEVPTLSQCQELICGEIDEVCREEFYRMCELTGDLK